MVHWQKTHRVVLQLAMEKDYPELAIHLIEHGASINQTDGLNM